MDELADSVNHLLLIGIFLINIGFVSLALKYVMKPTTYVEAVEFLSTKIGIAIVVLGGMHFFNMFALVRYRKSRLFRKLAPNTEDRDTQERLTTRNVQRTVWSPCPTRHSRQGAHPKGRRNLPSAFFHCQ